MNKDDITRMAREAGFVGFDGDNGSLRRFAALVAAAEREACAKVCEKTPPWPFRPSIEAAHAIRARGNT
jgi:hypothetical protein